MVTALSANYGDAGIEYRDLLAAGARTTPWLVIHPVALSALKATAAAWVVRVGCVFGRSRPAPPVC